MRNNLVKPPGVTVEYDSRHVRKQRFFDNPWEAKKFYIAKLNTGKNPKLLDPAGHAVSHASAGEGSGDAGPPAKRLAARTADVAGDVGDAHKQHSKGSAQAAASKVAVYVRVSTLDQEKGLKSQEQALAAYLEGHGLTATWYRDRLSGATTKRPAFERMQRDIFSGRVKTVVCWKLDRLSRSLRDGINVLCDWLEKDVRIVAVSQQLDFAGPVGQMVAGVLFAVAQMERENLRENTKRGLAAAKANGVVLGKRAKLFAKDIVPLLDQGLSMGAVARELGKTRQAIYNALAREGVQRKQQVPITCKGVRGQVAQQAR